MKGKIIVVAGGTGGHVYPALSIANELSSKFEILFVTDKRGEKYIGENRKNAIIQNINTKNRLYLYISIGINTLKSFCFLIKNRPNCVVGFGGYPSIPFVLAAQLLCIKTIIHEQNAVIGLANKLLSKMATKTLFSFEKYGNPTRFEDIYDDFKYTPSQKPKFKILVLGGSQGSKIITKSVTENLSTLPKDIRHNVFVYHQARIEDIDFVKAMYEKSQISYEIQSFFKNMETIYQNVDLVISRSGASTIFEIIGFKLPALLIPFANSINGDQKANAKILEKIGAVKVFDEKDLGQLAKTIQALYENRNILKKMSRAIQTLYKSKITKMIAMTINDCILP